MWNDCIYDISLSFYICPIGQLKEEPNNLYIVVVVKSIIVLQK